MKNNWRNKNAQDYEKDYCIYRIINIIYWS